MVKDLCFEILDTCPNNCCFCSSNSCITRDTEISLEDFKRVIDYFMQNGGIEELSISGGEPFLHPKLYDMVEYAKKYNIRVVIFTSGVKKRIKPSEEEIAYLEQQKRSTIDEVLAHEPWNERLIKNINKYYDNFLHPNEYSCITKEELERLKELGLDKIVFDFQGYEQETDAYLMGRDYKKRECLLDSILNASFVGLDTDIHFIPMKPNYKEIKDILELIEIAKVPNISILNFVPQGRGKINKENLQLTDNELQEFFTLLMKGKRYYTGNIRIGIPLQGENSHKCNAGLEKLDIKYDGTILPCPAFKEITIEECQKYGIRLHNIYDSLDKIKIPGNGTRTEPLCKLIYKRSGKNGI